MLTYTYRFSANYLVAPKISIADLQKGIRRGIETMFRSYQVKFVENNPNQSAQIVLIVMDFNHAAIRQAYGAQAHLVTAFSDKQGTLTRKIFGQPYRALVFNRNQMARPVESIRLVTAHELAHNVCDAPHIPGKNIMDPYLSGGVLTWSQADDAAIRRFIPRRTDVPLPWNDTEFWSTPRADMDDLLREDGPVLLEHAPEEVELPWFTELYRRYTVDLVKRYTVRQP